MGLGSAGRVQAIASPFWRMSVADPAHKEDDLGAPELWSVAEAGARRRWCSPSPPREDSREVAALKAQIAALESRPPAAAPPAQPLQALRTEITSQASSQAAAGHADAADLLFQVLDGNRDGMVSAAEFEGRAHRAEAEAREAAAETREEACDMLLLRLAFLKVPEMSPRVSVDSFRSCLCSGLEASVLNMA